MPEETEADEAARNVVRWGQQVRFDWQMFLIGWCGVFHLGLAFTLACAPYRQIFNAGTAPVYEIANRYVWAALFLLAGSLCFVLLRRQSALVQFATWFAVLPLGGAWLTAFVLAVLDGRGSAIGIVAWIALYVPPAIAGVRLALGKR